jgi:hypothetical protein
VIMKVTTRAASTIAAVMPTINQRCASSARQ